MNFEVITLFIASENDLDVKRQHSESESYCDAQ